MMKKIIIIKEGEKHAGQGEEKRVDSPSGGCTGVK